MENNEKIETISKLEHRLEILKKQYTGQEEIKYMIKEIESTINYLKGEHVQQRKHQKKDNTNLNIFKIPYREMVDTNYKFSRDISTHYLGIKLTYGKLISKIDKIANGLTNLGIKKNDIVSICMPTTLESIYLFYALNKIGAVTNAIDPRKEEEEIKHCINNAETKYIFAIDVAYEKIRNILDKTSLNKVYIVSPVESLPWFIRFAYNKSLFMESLQSKDKKIAYWNDFKRMTKESANVIEDCYIKNKLGIIEYTSGTTGKPKGVEITNDAISGIAKQYDLSGMKHERGDKFYNGIPLFLAFGEALGIHMPYMFGMQNIVNPAMENEKILYDLKKWKPEHTSLTPIHYVTMANNPDFTTYDMSNVKTLGVGADGWTIASKKDFNEKAKQNGCKVGIITGYGNSEHNSAFSTERDGDYKAGSCGKCLDGNEIIVVDPFTKEILPPNVIGQMILKGKYPMNGYRNNDKENNSAFIDFGGNIKGIYLGDYGYLDEEEYVFVKGREKDKIKISNAESIWPIDIENYISLIAKIKCCAAVELAEGKNCYPMIYIVRKSKYSISEIEEELKELLINLKKMYEIEFKYTFVDSLPITPNGKIDRTILRSQNVYNFINKDKDFTRTLKMQ